MSLNPIKIFPNCEYYTERFLYPFILYKVLTKEDKSFMLISYKNLDLHEIYNGDFNIYITMGKESWLGIITIPSDHEDFEKIFQKHDFNNPIWESKTNDIYKPHGNWNFIELVNDKTIICVVSFDHNHLGDLRSSDRDYILNSCEWRDINFVVNELNRLKNRLIFRYKTKTLKKIIKDFKNERKFKKPLPPNIIKKLKNSIFIPKKTLKYLRPC